MNRSISRYDMAQLITNIMTKQGFSASSSDKSAAIAKITDYNNIPSQYRDAVANVYALGIITGYSDGSFSGEVTMNRGQAAVVIYRMMQYSGNSGGNIANPGPETPVEPETPSTPSNPGQTAKTLTNGKPVTEANILELLSELQSKYPENTSFVHGYREGIKSYDVLRATSTYDRAKGGKPAQPLAAAVGRLLSATISLVRPVSRPVRLRLPTPVPMTSALHWMEMENSHMSASSQIELGTMMNVSGQGLQPQMAPHVYCQMGHELL